MDLESECSALESVEDNEVVVINPEISVSVDANKIENNGVLSVDEYGDDNLLGDVKPKNFDESSPPSTSKSPAGSAGSSPLMTTKGYGLKKWRRIKREFSKDGRSNEDTSKILKRGFSAPAANSNKPQGLSVETRQKSESSLSSTNGVLRSVGVGADGFALDGSSLDSRLAVEPNFAAGTESENSEDRSSKSSTAASVPKSRHEIPAVSGHVRDKNKMKTLSAKNLVNSVQRSQQGKSRVESSKKPRGERVKIEKENSHSSVESDSQSSNFVFMQGTNAVTSNGRQSGRSVNYDGENSGDEAQGGEQEFGEEIQTSYNKENLGEFEALSQEDLAADLSSEVKEEKVVNLRSLTDRDPLVESVHALQSAQEELEREVQKLREMGTEHISLWDGSTQGSSLPSEFISVDSKIPEASSSDLLHSGEITRGSSHFLETEVVSLKQDIDLLESKLEVANTMLRVKEAKVVELEDTLKINESPKEDTWSTTESQHKRYMDMEAELESLFKQKIEAEVEYLAISRTIQKFQASSVDQVMLFEEQMTLASDQAQMLNELGDTERRAATLKRQAARLEDYCEEIVETDQVLKLQGSVFKVTSCFFMQLILLLVVLVLLLFQLSPHYAGVVPT